jgi:hypothetical protein
MTYVIAKIQGEELNVDTSKMHESWIAHCLAYGIRRFVNDKYSGEKGQEKIDLCRMLIADMCNGEEMPVRVAGSTRAPKDPIKALAFKNAKQDLGAMFRKVTGATKAIDWAAHEKVKPFFNINADGKAIWNDETVNAWIVKQAAAGKDYMGEAKASLDATDKLDIALDF